jgi:hypothetical protein
MQRARKRQLYNGSGRASVQEPPILHSISIAKWCPGCSHAEVLKSNPPQSAYQWSSKFGTWIYRLLSSNPHLRGVQSSPAQHTESSWSFGHDQRNLNQLLWQSGSWRILPVLYSCVSGDLPMCSGLYVHGTDNGVRNQFMDRRLDKRSIVGAFPTKLAPARYVQ